MYSAVDIQKALVDVLEDMYDIPRSGWRVGGWQISKPMLYGDIYGGQFAVGTVDVGRVIVALKRTLNHHGYLSIEERHPDDTRIRIKYAIELEKPEAVNESKQASKQASAGD